MHTDKAKTKIIGVRIDDKFRMDLMDNMDSRDNLAFLSPFCLLCPLGPQNAGLRQKYAVKYKEQMKHSRQFQNREYFNLKICQAAGIFKIKEDKSFCHKPSKRQKSRRLAAV